MDWDRNKVDAYIRRWARQMQSTTDDLNENRSAWAESEEEFRLGMEHCMGYDEEEIEELIKKIHEN